MLVYERNRLKRRNAAMLKVDNRGNVDTESFQLTSPNCSTVMSASSSNISNGKNTVGHANIEKQATHETFAAAPQVPKTLGAGVCWVSQMEIAVH